MHQLMQRLGFPLFEFFFPVFVSNLSSLHQQLSHKSIRKKGTAVIYVSWCDVNHFMPTVGVHMCPARRSNQRLALDWSMNGEELAHAGTTARMDLGVHTVTLTLTRVHMEKRPLISVRNCH
jgi:hypothetical protein